MSRTIALRSISALRLSLVIAVGIAIAGSACSRATKPPDADSIIDDFRLAERAALAAFNGLLRRQRANEIDELGLASAIDHEVLPQWRALRARVESATAMQPQRRLYLTLRHYLAARQRAWEAYATALRSPTDQAARPYYDTYHTHDAAAVEDARILGQAFRAR